MTESVQPRSTWQQSQAFFLRLVRGAILSLVGVIVAGVSVGTLWIPFNADPGPDPMPWFVLFGIVGFIAGCAMRSSQLGPRSSSVIAATLVGTVIGLFGLYLCGVVAADIAVSLASFPPAERPHSYSKFHPGIAFTQVAVPWGYFGGTAIGLFVGLGRVASKRAANRLFATAAVIAIAVASVVWFQFDVITRGYVKAFSEGNHPFFHHRAR